MMIFCNPANRNRMCSGISFLWIFGPTISQRWGCSTPSYSDRPCSRFLILKISIVSTWSEGFSLDIYIRGNPKTALSLLVNRTAKISLNQRELSWMQLKMWNKPLDQILTKVTSYSVFFHCFNYFNTQLFYFLFSTFFLSHSPYNITYITNLAWSVNKLLSIKEDTYLRQRNGAPADRCFVDWRLFSRQFLR